MLFRNAAGKLFADSKAVGESQYAVPGAELHHMGFGEFYLSCPQGKVEFDRMRGEAFEGQSGRSHLVYGDAEAVALFEKCMAAAELAKCAAPVAVEAEVA